MPARTEPHPLELYELCVQEPLTAAAMLRRLHGARPRVLAEDFAGSAALSRAWLIADPEARAIATDLDPAAVAYAAQRAANAGIEPARLRLVNADVRSIARPEPADVVFVGNFSIGELHERAELVEYLRAARGRLNPRGIFACDTYGGAAAYRTGHVQRTHTGREPRERIHYTWQQRRVDAFTGRVENALHFRVENDGEVIAELFDAFVYDWRLWSVPELRDALREAGFAETHVIAGTDADAPALRESEAAEHHIVCVLARG